MTHSLSDSLTDWFQGKDERDRGPAARDYPFKLKLLAYILLAASYLGMLFYIFLFGVSQQDGSDNSFLGSFTFWLVLDCIVVSTLQVFIWHFIVPNTGE